MCLIMLARLVRRRNRRERNRRSWWTSRVHRLGACIALFDAAAIRTHLAAHGIPAGPVEQRYGAEGDGPSIYVTDPEGNVVELKGPPGDPH